MSVRKSELPEHLGKTYTPTVEIIDEEGTGYITDKIKTAVGMLEEDFQEYGYKVSKAIVPSGMTREIDVYLDGMDTYFKIHVDRNTSESAEDAVRMINYLDKKDIKAQYVDVRIAGRAYYKGVGKIRTFPQQQSRLVENLYNIFAKIPKNCQKKHLHFKIKTIILKSVDKRIKTTNKKNRYERSGDKDTRRVRLRSYSPVQE